MYANTAVVATTVVNVGAIRFPGAVVHAQSQVTSFAKIASSSSLFQRSNLGFQQAVLSLQIINILLMGVVLAPHKLDVFSGLFQNLCPTCFLALQRRYRITEGCEAVLNVVTSFALQGIMVGPLFRLGVKLASTRVPRLGLGVVRVLSLIAVYIDVPVVVAHVVVRVRLLVK